MTKDFKKKTKNKIKKLVKQKNLKLYIMKITFGECSKNDYESVCNILLDLWHKMYSRSLLIICKYFAGFTRELIIEIDDEIIKPYLYILLFKDKNAIIPYLKKLKEKAFFSIIKASNIIEREDFEKLLSILNISFDEVPMEQYDKVLDDLMLPCIRVIKENKELEELIFTYQYNKQLCSRGGIVSRQNLERNVSLEVER